MSSCVRETGLVAMDCLVVCCCCPCLVLQVTVFLFVRLPRKVVVKTKRIILRRWHRRGPASSSSKAAGLKLADLLDLDDGFEAAFGTREEEVAAADDVSASDWKERCFAVGGDDDFDDVWEAIIEQEGLFWFGSFWGRREQEGSASEGDDRIRMDGSFRLPVALQRVCE